MVLDASMKDMFNFENMYKLRTEEGAKHYHVHRYMGVLVLLNYIYRTTLRYTTGKPFGDDEASWEVLFVIVLHSALSLSSLLFHIPQKRNTANPMIWPEFRLHSILFGCRSFIAMLWVWICLRSNIALDSIPAKIGRILIVFINLYLADIVTIHYKKIALVLKDDSTMRRMPFPKEWTQSTTDWITIFYSLLQFIATSAVMLNTNQYTLLMSAIPVQLAAFLMTCVRKSIMTAKGWHYWYMVSFVLALTSITNVVDLVINLGWGTVLYCVRRYGRCSKYILWGVVACVAPVIVVMPPGNPFLSCDEGETMGDLQREGDHQGFDANDLFFGGNIFLFGADSV